LFRMCLEHLKGHRTCLRSSMTAALSCQLPPCPAKCRSIFPTAALSFQLPPYPANCRPILPTASLSCQLPPYPANCRSILPTAALSCQLPPYPLHISGHGRVSRWVSRGSPPSAFRSQFRRLNFPDFSWLPYESVGVDVNSQP
jgi:hypothetical protein